MNVLLIIFRVCKKTRLLRVLSSWYCERKRLSLIVKGSDVLLSLEHREMQPTVFHIIGSRNCSDGVTLHKLECNSILH